jgi:hypothetical protein
MRWITFRANCEANNLAPRVLYFFRVNSARLLGCPKHNLRRGVLRGIARLPLDAATGRRDAPPLEWLAIQFVRHMERGAVFRNHRILATIQPAIRLDTACRDPLLNHWQAQADSGPNTN